VRVLSQDERRVGLLTVRRRRLTARGVQPVGSVQHVCDWCSVDGAVAPATGERCCLALPSLHAALFQLFVEAFAHAFPDRLNILRLDTSGAHTAQKIRWPEPGRAVWLPPYCPELHPIARGWRDLKDDLAWHQFIPVDTQQDYVSQRLQAYEASTRPSLTSDTSLVEAINALAS